MLTYDQICDLRQQILTELGLTIIQLDDETSHTSSKWEQMRSSKASQSSADHQTRKAESFRQQLLIRQQVLEAALGRIKARTYGFCLGCNDLIPVEQLEADPALAYCPSCSVKADMG